MTQLAPAAHMGLIWAQLNRLPSHLLSLAGAQKYPHLVAMELLPHCLILLVLQTAQVLSEVSQ